MAYAILLLSSFAANSKSRRTCGEISQCLHENVHIKKAHGLRTFFTGVAETAAHAQEARMTRVLVADDFPLVREALAAALARHPEIEVVGLAGDGVEALELAHEHQPDVVVLDLRMPRMSGLVALTRLTAELPCTRVLLLTACEEPDTVIDAVSAGAAGFVTKRTGGAELALAVLAVSRGEPVVSPSLTAHLVRGLRRDNRDRRGGTTGQLTSSELNVLRLVADGRTDKQISATLFISPRTVQSHLAQVRTKTGVRRRTQLARWATEHLVT